MSATMTHTKPWFDRPVSELTIPSSTKAHVVKHMHGGKPVKTWGDVWAALEDGADIGLTGQMQERVRAQIEDAIKAHEQAKHPAPEAAAGRITTLCEHGIPTGEACLLCEDGPPTAELNETKPEPETAIPEERPMSETSATKEQASEPTKRGRGRPKKAEAAPETNGTPETNAAPAPSANGKHETANTTDTSWHRMGDALKTAMKASPDKKQIRMDEEIFADMYALKDRLVAENHPHLIEGEAEVGLVWNTKPKFKGGKVAAGNCRLVPGLYRLYVPYHFLIELDVTAWEKMSPQMREAEMDFQLCRAFCEEKKEDKQGRTGWTYKLRSPDVVEFMEVAQRYPNHRADLAALLEAIGPKKPNLFTEAEGGEAQGEAADEEADDTAPDAEQADEN